MKNLFQELKHSSQSFLVSKNNSLGRFFSFTLNFTLSLVFSFSFLACGEPQAPLTTVDDPFSCDVESEEALCQENIVPAHSPDCIAVDDELCLISFSWTDQGPRTGVLHPSEELKIKEISIFNAGSREITLVELNSLLATADIEAPAGNLQLTELLGKAWFNEDSALSEEARVSNEESCQQGRLDAQRACTFSLDLSLKVKETAPNNAVQRVKIAVDSQRGSRFEWSLPLLVVHTSGNLSLASFSVEESSEDELVHAGDALRFDQIKLLNHSFAPFVALEALLVFEDEQISNSVELTRWDGVEASGILSSAPIRCEAARRIDDSIQEGECDFEFADLLRVNPQLSAEDLLSFTMYIKEQNQLLEDQFDFAIELNDWETELRLEAVSLSADENRDRFASPSERISVNQFVLENNSVSALSVRGRVLIESDWVSVSNSSDLSINESELREDFYEHCPALSSCPLQSNLLLEINSETPIGELIPINLELIDHTGQVYELSTELEIRLPDVELELSEFDIQQDTLDRDLSAGERGVISYLKFVNQGLADASALQVLVSSDSEYIQFEDASTLHFALNTHSDFLDERSSDCPSQHLESDGYCYKRPEIYFNLSESTPLGEIINFQIQVLDAWGTEYRFNEQISVF
mgnify:CR=1 FL=1